MASFIGKRFLQVIPTLFGVLVVTFLLMRFIPGDPTTMSGQTVTEDVRAALRKEWHLDEPVHKQFYHYVKGIPKLDLGVSMRFGTPVRGMLLEYFKRTLQLAVAAFILSVTLGIAFGIISALMKDTWVDRGIMVLALIGISTPVFVVGILLIIVAVALGWRHISGTGMSDGIDVRYLVLPAVTLGSRSIAYLARMTRSSILEVSEADFLRTARAKGLSERVVVFKHLMKNAMIPIITVVGLNFADYLTGAILTETVFQWPGIGFLIRNAIAFRDLPVIMGAVLFTTTVFVLVNFLVDLAYAFFDPRIRYS
jgi:ABC-type dipeptide/oligopeptide/nickel transport system permease component